MFTLVVLVAAAPAAVAQAAGATCDPARIDAESYRFTTEAQALNVTAPRHEWWDSFFINRHVADLDDLNDTATWLAEQARDLDDRNLMAHALLARQYVATGADAALADAEWRRTLDEGGAVVWTATLYDVDGRSFFVVAIDRAAMRIYRLGQFVDGLETHLGVPVIPGPAAARFWRAWGGCVDPAVAPVAVVPWTDVREIKAGNWVLWFKLTRPIEVISDRGKRKRLGEIKVNLHGATGEVELHPVYDGRTFKGVSGVGIGPAFYQERVRQTIVKFVDPAGRIALPPQKRGAGW
jgi:hypothetical protein